MKTPERPDPHSQRLAATFSPGEKVRLLHSTESGVVRQVYGNGKLLVLIDDFIEIELDAREVVKASIPPPAETPARQQAQRLERAAEANLAPAIYFAIEPESGSRYRYHLVNNTAWTVLFTVFVLKNEQATGRLHGRAEPATAQILFTTTAQSWDEEANLLFQFLYFHHAPQSIMEPKIKSLRLRAAYFLREPRYIPILEAEGILLDLVEVELLRPAEQRREMLVRNRPPDPLSPYEQLRHDIVVASEVEPVVDLHLEALTDQTSQIPANDILPFQLEEFERCMSLALVHDLDEITFIHGIGSGRLRDAIHERLRHYHSVRRFEIDRSGKYGQGATKVYFT